MTDNLLRYGPIITYFIGSTCNLILRNRLMKQINSVGGGDRGLVNFRYVGYWVLITILLGVIVWNQ